MITISLCLIVKNEEHTLDQCLSSVEGVPDEIIIVDTGSTDRTKEIAHKWTSHVYDFEWIDDFAAARNASFSYATKEYIFWLDADDVLTPREKKKLIELKSSLPSHVDAVAMKYQMLHGFDSNATSHTTRLRLVKREKGFTWKGIVHEDLSIDEQYQYFNSDIIVTHTKEMSNPNGAPSRRNIDIYERHLAKGYDLNVSDMFHYARECVVNKEYDKAITYFEKCQDSSEISLENKIFLLHKLATCYVMNGQPEKELPLTLKALSLDTPYPAFSCRMGEHFLKQGHVEAAIFWYTTAYKQPLPARYSWSVADNIYHTWLPHHQLAHCYEGIGDLKQAQFHREQAAYYKKQGGPAHPASKLTTEPTHLTSPQESFEQQQAGEDRLHIHRGLHADTFSFLKSGTPFIQKQFRDTPEATACFHNEKRAQEVFSKFSWLPKWHTSDERSFTTDMYAMDNRLDTLSHVLSESAKDEVLGQIMSVILDLYVKGYAHRDIHARNIFCHNGVQLIDYEYLIKYPDDHLPLFLESYDITGQGLPSPYNTQNMGFLNTHPLSISRVFHATLDKAIRTLGTTLIHELTQVSQDFQKKEGRHRHSFSRPYCSFSLPKLTVTPQMAQRDGSRRLKKFEIKQTDLREKTLLDLGCHYGGMLFESQKLQPKMSLGIEFDHNKVHMGRKVAALNHLTNVHFKQGDIDHLTAQMIDGPYDIVYSLAMEAHVKDPHRMYQLLGDVTKELLLFEGNATTHVEEVKEKLQAVGFQKIDFIGFCDDDFMDVHNNRPLFKAWK
ncbi:glycosyltransferase [Shouchella lonarensis]|uniref:Methyltransferase domain-containing protein n=1 Tax=Shouchella lonarensis TaxID=1464122 RepID=A0A1G6KT37_9BACI|nr:glycosyltransferase [Shouchella lonarensis]SDC34097.1 Methyltransferase domain-containing protein [Shouchella lonarensis]